MKPDVLGKDIQKSHYASDYSMLIIHNELLKKHSYSSLVSIENLVFVKRTSHQ